MKLPLLLPAWMLAAGLLAGQTVPAAPQPPADNAIRNDEVERPVLVFEHDLSPASNGVHLCKGEHEAWVNIVINTSSINSCFKGTIGHHLTIGPPLPQYRFDYQVFFKGGMLTLPPSCSDIIIPSPKTAVRSASCLWRRIRAPPSIP